MITGEIALTNLKHVLEVRNTASGTKVECIVIPLPTNHLEKTEKGVIRLKFTAFDKKKDGTAIEEPIINQNPGKEVLAKLKEAGQWATTLGNLKFWDNSATTATPQQADVSTATEAKDDLPF